MPMLKNQRHELFCQGVVAGKNQMVAYIDAGYDENESTAKVNASRLMKRPDIAERIDELSQQVLEAAHPQFRLTKQWVIEKLITNANRALQEVEVRGADGEPKGVFVYEGGVANRALELLGKELGMFIERQEIDQNTKIISAEPMKSDQWEQTYGRAEPKAPSEPARPGNGAAPPVKAGPSRH